MEQTTEQAQDFNRNPEGKGGFKDNPQNRNNGGRIKNSLKEFVREKFAKMEDNQKEVWLKENNITGIDQWKMSEGNPQTNTDVTTGGKPIIMSNVILDKNNVKTDGE